MSKTDKMAIDVMSLVNSENLIEDCPQIGEVPEFVNFLSQPQLTDNGKSTRLTREMIVLYIVLMYSVDSILNKSRSKTQADRKKMAAMMLNFPKKPGKGNVFIDYVEKYILTPSETISQLIIGYLKHQHNYKWRLILSTENMIDEFLSLMDKKIEGKDDKQEVDAVEKKGKIRAQADKMIDDLERLYKDLFKGDSDAENAYKVSRRTLEDTAKVNR